MYDYIKESSSFSLNEHSLFSSIDIIIKDPLPDTVDIELILSSVEKLIPRHLTTNIDIIYVGQFQDLIDREVNSIYKDGAIYVTNDQYDNEDMIDDIVHEIAHSVEEKFGADIYGNSELEVEFLKKRKHLHNYLDSHGFEIDSKFQLDPEFNQEYDDFLHKEVGYGPLEQLSSGLFLSPYAITSLREYFANGFEHYYLNKGSDNVIYKVSPALYRVLKKLHDLEEL